MTFTSVDDPSFSLIANKQKEQIQPDPESREAKLMRKYDQRVEENTEMIKIRLPGAQSTRGSTGRKTTKRKKKRIHYAKENIWDLIHFRCVLVLACLTLLSSLYNQFIAISTEMLTKRFNLTLITTKNKMTLFVFESVITVPIFAYLMDKKGKKPLYFVISSILALIGFGSLCALPDKPELTIYASLFIISQFYSLGATVAWTMLPLSVPPRTIYVIFGLSSVTNSISNSFLPLLVGEMLVEKTYAQFQTVLYFFVGISILLLIGSVVLMAYDYSSDQLLTLVEKDKRVKQIRRSMALKYDQISLLRPGRRKSSDSMKSLRKRSTLNLNDR